MYEYIYINIYIHMLYILTLQTGWCIGMYFSINFLGLALPGKVLHRCTGLNG